MWQEGVGMSFTYKLKSPGEMTPPSSPTCCCPWSHGLWPKKLLVSVAVPPTPVRVSSQRPLALSRRSLMIKVIIKIILGAVHRSPNICLIAEENPKQPQLGDHLMKRLCDQSSPQMGSLSYKLGW